MPDYQAILAFYQAVAACLLAGALPDEARAASQSMRDQAAAGFLARRVCPRCGCAPASFRPEDRILGELRLRRWERANPDIVAVLWRRAERLALQHGFADTPEA